MSLGTFQLDKVQSNPRKFLRSHLDPRLNPFSCGDLTSARESWRRFGPILLSRSAHPAIPSWARKKRANSLGSIFSLTAYCNPLVQRLRMRKSGFSQVASIIIRSG
jgi:hypothetical protein